MCVKGLPSVFNTSNRPWINIGGATSNDIINQVQQCPSGALSIHSEIVVEKSNLEAQVTDTSTKAIELDKNKSYA